MNRFTVSVDDLAMKKIRSDSKNDEFTVSIGDLDGVERRNYFVYGEKLQSMKTSSQTSGIGDAGSSEVDRVKTLMPRQLTKRERVLSESEKRRVRLRQDEQIREFRDLLANSLASLERLEKLQTVNLRKK